MLLDALFNILVLNGTDSMSATLVKHGIQLLPGAIKGISIADSNQTWSAAYHGEVERRGV